MENNNNAKSTVVSLKRLPGQALRDERDKLIEEQINDPLTIAFCACVLLVLECLHVLSPIKPNIWIGVGFALPTVLFAAYKCFSARRKLHNIRRGEEGERIAARAIEETLLPLGYKVIHDIQFTNNKSVFNIDHLIIGKNGIFVVDTKNNAKPKKGDAIVSYNGQRLSWNGQLHDQDEIAQVRASSNNAKEYIARKTGIELNVRPVVCAIGWFAKSSDLYKNPVLLVMEKTIGTVIPRVRTSRPLTEEEQRCIYWAFS